MVLINRLAWSGAERAEHMRMSLDLLQGPERVVELRVPNFGRKGRVDSGYYNDFSKLIDDAFRYDQARGIYVSLNEVEPSLLARSANHMHQFAEQTAANHHVLRRCWLSIYADLFPFCPTAS